MMTQINAPIHSNENDHKNPNIYYEFGENEIGNEIFESLKNTKKTFGNFYLANETSYINSDLNSSSLSFSISVKPNSENLAVQPNHEKPIFHEVGFAPTVQMQHSNWSIA